MAAPLRRTHLISDPAPENKDHQQAHSATIEHARARRADGDELLDRLEQEIDRRIQAEQTVRELGRQLAEAERMETVVWQVASGIHDLNNLMSVTITSAEWVLGKLAADDPSREALEDIRTASQRAADLVGHLLVSARSPSPKTCSLEELLSGAESRMRHLLGSERELELIQAPAVGSVCVDPTEMENMLMNLVANARDAMPPGGKLTIETRNADASVVIEVRDTGTGMRPSTAAHIFEPFFTTKERGTGIGLSSVRRTVKERGGDVFVHSELGRGTTVEIHLPRLVPGRRAVSRT